MEVIGVFKQKPKKIEDIQPGNVTSPSVTSDNATANSSIFNGMNQNTENIKSKLQQVALQAHKLRKK